MLTPLVVLLFLVASVAAIVRYTRSFALEPLPPPAPVKPQLTAAAKRAARIEVEVVTPRSCAVRGCEGETKATVALSSTVHLHLCSEHALALEFQRVRWGIRDPRAALRGLGRVKIVRA